MAHNCDIGAQNEDGNLTKKLSQCTKTWFSGYCREVCINWCEREESKGKIGGEGNNKFLKTSNNSD